MEFMEFMEFGQFAEFIQFIQFVTYVMCTYTYVCMRVYACVLHGNHYRARMLRYAYAMLRLRLCMHTKIGA